MRYSSVTAVRYGCHIRQLKIRDAPRHDHSVSQHRGRLPRHRGRFSPAPGALAPGTGGACPRHRRRLPPAPGTLAPAHSRNGRAGGECRRISPPPTVGSGPGYYPWKMFEILDANSCFMEHFQPGKYFLRKYKTSHYSIHCCRSITCTWHGVTLN